MEKYIFDQNNDLWYELQGDYYIPCLVLEETDAHPIGMWGRKHLRYIKEHRPVLWNRLVLTGTLYKHLHEIEQAAQSRINLMLPKLAEAASATEALKAADPMKWTGLMNSCKAQAEEVVLSELIYS